MGSLDDYKKATKNRKVIVGNLAKNFLPNVNEDDYRRGYIMRYFTKARNNRDGLIIEIDQAQYNSHTDLSGGLQFNFYNVVSIRWKIVGTLEDVQMANFNILQETERNFNGILKKVGNILQFARLI